MSHNFEYDAVVDSLYIYGDKAEEEKIAGSLVLGNLILDLSSGGDVIGVEVDNASTAFNLSSQILSKIEDARLKTTIQGNLLVIAFMVHLDKREYNFSYMVPKNKIELTA